MTNQPTQSHPAQAMPVAVVTHTIARIQGNQDGDVTVFHARTSTARMTLTWGGMLMTFWSAEATQSVLEGFSAARPLLTRVVRDFAPAPHAGEPFVQQSLALDWTRRAAYAVVAREEMSRDKRRVIRWIDVHMGPVTWQILDRTGYHSALALLRRAHQTGVHVFTDGRRFAADPTEDHFRSVQ